MMQKLDPNQQNKQTTYNPKIDLYLSFNNSQKEGINKIFKSEKVETIPRVKTIHEYTGTDFIEPKGGIFAVGDLDTYLPFVQQIKETINLVKEITQNELQRNY